jgi:hypothetical protein
MTKKSLLLVGFVSACSLALAGAKSYEIVIAHPSVAGSVQLPAGEYKLTVADGTATFTDAHSKKTVTAPVKVETAKTKYASTAVETSTEGKTERVAAIRLGGSTSKIQFVAAPAAKPAM